MPLFIIETTAESSIREFWQVEAESAQQARDKFEAGQVGAAFLWDEVQGDETEREVAQVHPRADLAGTIALHNAQQEAPAMLEALQRIANDSSAWGECVNIAADAITSATDQTPTSPALGAAGGTDTASGADLHDFAREWVATYDTENYAGAGGYDGGGFTYDDMQDAFEAGARFIPAAEPAPPAGGIEPVTDFAAHAATIEAAHGYVSNPAVHNPPSPAQVAHLLALSGISHGPIGTDQDGEG